MIFSIKFMSMKINHIYYCGSRGGWLLKIYMYCVVLCTVETEERALHHKSKQSVFSFQNFKKILKSYMNCIVVHCIDRREISALQI
jgi:hypothetical protein